MNVVLRRRPNLLHSWVRPDAPPWLVPAATLTASLFAIFSLLALAGPPVTDIDQWFFDLHLAPPSSPWHEPLTLWVMLAQRVPALCIVGLYALHRTRRAGSAEPLVLFGTAAILFMGSVAALKYFTGRIGPRASDQAHSVWAGGTIYPSGHVTGAVVLYGVLVLLVPPVARRVAAKVAIALMVSIGVAVVALNTHWWSDVIGAMLNGALVLMVSWAITPAVHRRLLHRRYAFGPVPT